VLTLREEILPLNQERIIEMERFQCKMKQKLELKATLDRGQLTHLYKIFQIS